VPSNTTYALLRLKEYDNNCFSLTAPTSGQYKANESKRYKHWQYGIAYRFLPIYFEIRPNTAGECGILKKNLGIILANDGRCACEFKSSISMAKAALTRRGLFLLAKWT
jgi:hypothetical protein